MASLYTEGGQFTYNDGTDYVGFYHIMPDGTPMAGAQHGSNDEMLFYVNSTPNADNEIRINGNPFVTEINPNIVLSNEFSLADSSIIPSSGETSEFDPSSNTIEFFCYDINRNLVGGIPDYKSFKTSQQLRVSNDFSEILLDPAFDADQIASDPSGQYFNIYNFIQYEISSSAAEEYYISEISSDRTEIRLQSNLLTSEEINNAYNSFKQKIDSSNFFDEFYIKNNRNNYYIGVNILLDETTDSSSLLVKLYQPLPSNINIKTRVSVATKVAETKAYQVDFPRFDDQELPKNFIKGPNTNIKVKDKVNNSTDFKSKNNLTSTTVSSAVDQLEYFTSQSGIQLNPSYSVSVYDDFVHFSSAEQRLRNFYYKVQQIESFQSQIDILNGVTDTNTTAVSSSKLTLERNVKELITTFDGFEYFLYFESGSQSYPKSTTTYPYTLQSSTSTEVRTWLGSTDEDNLYYGGALLSASFYDEDNVNNLLYVIPEYIRSNPDNSNYILFANMVGQYFDETWLYTKAVTHKLNSTNQLDKGADLSLVDDILRSFGQEIYGSNFNNIDDYSSLIGVSAEGSILPATGSEVITNFVTASNDVTPLKRVNQEIHKRLYHNLVTLYKKKGTKAGLRQLINLYGIPDTILRIYEFGGKDKINLNDWDLYRSIFNKEITSHQTDADRGKEYNGGIETPWKINPSWASSSTIAGVTGSVPATVEFRFKSDINPATTPSQSIPLQPLWGLKDNAGDTKVLVYLEYNGSGSASGSYSGSIVDPNNQYANLTLAVSGSPPTSASISLPFYNQDWWNVRVQMQELGLAGTNQARYQMASANKTYNGKDGTRVGFKASIKHNQISGSWVNSISSSFALSRSFNSKQYNNFSGSLQELRYWALCFENQNTPFINEDVWDNHVMDPLSIETGYLTGSMSPIEHLIFRSREGEDLALVSGSQSNISQLESIHPKITGSLATTSSFASNSLYSLITASISNNVETQFLNQPNLGIKNRVSDKIKTYNNLAYGNLLSPYRSIQQNYEASQSFIEDINLLQVAFSPQDEVNDDITHEFGFSNKITDLIADPRNLSSSLDHYDGLKRLAEKYFEKYIKGNSNDYYRLIKYFDNALFKAIKNFVPARTSVSTGIVIKQHLLERNRVRPPQPNSKTSIAKTNSGSFNTNLGFQNIAVSGAVKSQPKGFTTGSSIEKVTGGTGGTFEKFNNIEFTPYGVSGSGPTKKFGYEITQSFTEAVSTLSGSINVVKSTQDEFYNGEFKGSTITVTTQSLNPECLKFLNVFIDPVATSSFDYFLYNEAQTSSFAKFNNVSTTPNSGQIFFNWVSAANYIRNLKVSTTNKEGADITNNIENATRLNFNFGTSTQNFNVTKTSQGPGYIQFDVDSNNYHSPHPEFLLSSSYENYPFLASASIAQSASVKVDTVFYLPNGQSETININQYGFENDPNNLFNATSGIYTTPQTPNLLINFTGSINLTGSVITDFNASQNATVTFRLKGSSVDVFQKVINESISTTVNTFSGSFTVSGSFNTNVPLKAEDLSLELGMSLPALAKGQSMVSGSITGSGALFQINTGSLLPNPKTTILDSFEPYLPGGSSLASGFAIFERAFDCQPLFNNVISNRLSSLYYDIDYSTGVLVPTNIVPIENQTAIFASIPDSNYTSLRSILPRYNGSKLTSFDINKFTPKGTEYYEKQVLKIWGGDSSYGKTSVIERTKPFFGYFQLLVPSSPELELATQVKLKYIINQDGQPFKPILNSPSFYDVEGAYETGNTIDIALEDTLQTDDASLVNAAVGINLDNFNKSATVIKGARRVDPIITTQRVSIYDVPNAADAFETNITFTNPLPITSDYTMFSSNPIATSTAFTAMPQRITFIDENYDNSDSWNTSTNEFTFSETSQSPVRFQGNVSLQNLNTSDVGFVIRIVRERSSVRTALAETIVVVPANTQSPFINVGTPFLDFQTGDKIYMRASIVVFAAPNVSTPDDQIPLSSGQFVLKGGYLKAIPAQLPTITLSPPYWSTGSAYGNYLTSSLSMSMVYGEIQEQYSNSTFKPINEPFTIQVGDEIRIQGREDRVFLVNEVKTENTNFGVSGSIVVKVEPEVPPLLNLDHFLLRRYNPDGTSVLINMTPPSSSFATTKGLIKNETINVELEENINNIVAKLSEEGTI
jgi:hypothetical protein